MSSSDPSAFDRDYQALRLGRAIVELVDWSSISVTGADRQTFLHNFCTNDVKRLAPGTSCEAFFTNVKGKVVAHGLIHCREAELVIVGTPGQAERLVAHLDRYVIREDVVLRDVTAERSYLLVTGDVPIDGQAISMTWPITGRTDSKLHEVEAHAKPGVVRALEDQGVILVDQQTFEAARIEAGMPRFGVDFSEENLPQEVSRDRQAISFNKGCYLGQETVARIDALGHVNQQLATVRFVSEALPQVGIELLRGDRVVGKVTSIAFSPRLGRPLGLAMIRREANSAETQLSSAVGQCDVVALQGN